MVRDLTQYYATDTIFTNETMKFIKSHFTLFSLIVLSLAAGWIAFTAFQFPNSTQGRIPAPREGFFAPKIELTSLDNISYNLSDLNGQVVIVNFWASWCPPCKAEMPAIEETYQKYKDQGLVILGINLTSSDDVTKVDQFVHEYALTFPILLDEKGETANRYQVSSLPTTFFINKDGVIEKVIIGGPMSEAALQSQVLQMLEEKP